MTDTEEDTARQDVHELTRRLADACRRAGLNADVISPTRVRVSRPGTHDRLAETVRCMPDGEERLTWWWSWGDPDPPGRRPPRRRTPHRPRRHPARHRLRPARAVRAYGPWTGGAGARREYDRDARETRRISTSRCGASTGSPRCSAATTPKCAASSPAMPHYAPEDRYGSPRENDDEPPADHPDEHPPRPHPRR